MGRWPLGLAHLPSSTQPARERARTATCAPAPKAAAERTVSPAKTQWRQAEVHRTCWRPLTLPVARPACCAHRPRSTAPAAACPAPPPPFGLPHLTSASSSTCMACGPSACKMHATSSSSNHPATPAGRAQAGAAWARGRAWGALIDALTWAVAYVFTVANGGACVGPAVQVLRVVGGQTERPYYAECGSMWVGLTQHQALSPRRPPFAFSCPPPPRVPSPICMRRGHNRPGTAPCIPQQALVPICWVIPQAGQWSQHFVRNSLPHASFPNAHALPPCLRTTPAVRKGVQQRRLCIPRASTIILFSLLLPSQPAS